MIAKLSGSQVQRIVFGGGDPFLRKDLKTLITYAVSAGLEVEVQTNGENPYKMCVAELASSVSTWGLSVDSAEEKIHDGVRGKRGNYRKVWELASYLIDLHVPLNLRTVVCKPTLQTFGGIGDKLLAIAFTGKWYLLQYTPVGDEAHNRELFDITPAEFHLSTDSVRARYAGAGFQSIPVPDLARRSIYFLIAPDGAVYNHPPPGVPYSIVGNVLSDEFSKLLDRLNIDYNKHYSRYGFPSLVEPHARPAGMTAEKLVSITPASCRSNEC